MVVYQHYSGEPPSGAFTVAVTTSDRIVESKECTGRLEGESSAFMRFGDRAPMPLIAISLIAALRAL
jgi:hypothetical protein